MPISLSNIHILRELSSPEEVTTMGSPKRNSARSTGFALWAFISLESSFCSFRFQYRISEPDTVQRVDSNSSSVEKEILETGCA